MPPPTTTTRARSGKLALVTGGSPVIMLRFSESGTGARLLPASICGRICAVCGRPGVVRPTAVCQLLATGELAVADSVRPSCLGSESLDLVLLVRLEVALEPEPVGPALPRQDVRGDPVKEPPVVAGEHGTARKLHYRVLQSREAL